MRQIGIIETCEGEYAQVQIQRTSACGEHCASCKGGCRPTKQTVRAKNPVHGRPGDKVMLEMESSKILFAGLLVYIIPLLALILGYLAGAALLQSEGAGIITGMLLMIGCFFGISIVDKRLKTKYELIIVKNMSK